MAKITLLFASVLIAVGLIGYFGIPTEAGDDAKPAVESQVDGEEANAGESKKPKRSFTALIPSGFGLLLLICGVIGLQESARKHAMHAAATIALVGFLAGSVQLFRTLGKVLSPDAEVNWRSFGFVALMTVICAVFVAMCFNSFMQARKERKEQESMAMRTDGNSDPSE